jgi:hypothetical protein
MEVSAIHKLTVMLNIPRQNPMISPILVSMYRLYSHLHLNAFFIQPLSLFTLGLDFIERLTAPAIQETVKQVTARLSEGFQVGLTIGCNGHIIGIKKKEE